MKKIIDRKKINISLPIDIISKVDEDVAKELSNRSAWFMKAAQLMLEQNRKKRLDEIIKK